MTIPHTFNTLINKISKNIKKVNNGYVTECWEHKGTYGGGYARIWIAELHKTISVHRYMYWYHLDNKPNWEQFEKQNRTFFVCHHCDNSKCCNPDHLFLGTQKDNVQDSIKKNRHITVKVFGENHGSHKLTEQEVMKIVNLPGTHHEIGKKFNVEHTTIGNIKRGITWSWLTGIKKGASK